MTSNDQRMGRTGRAARRGVLVLLALVAWLTIGGVGGPLVGRLSEVQTNDNASVLPSRAEATTVEKLSTAFASTSTLPYFVVLSRPSGLTAPDRAFAASFAKELPGLTLSPLGEQGRTYRLGDFLAPGPVVPVPSEDGQAVLLIASLDGDRADEVLDGGDTAVTVAAEGIRDALADAPAGLQSHITGPGGIVADLVTAFEGIDGKLLGVALLAVFVILLLVYRSPVLPVAVLLTSLVGLSGAAMVVFHLARAGTITVSGMTQGILFILVVGAATDYSLLLVARYREELHDERSTFAAMRRAWRGSLPPIVASATTVVLGLLCLSLSQLGSTRSLGPVGAIGIVGALLAALTFLPVVLLVGRWIFWPRVPHVDHVRATESVGRRGRRDLWGRVARLVGLRPRTVWVVTAACLAAAAAFAPTFQASGVSQTDTFRTDVDSVVGQQVLAQHFPAGSGSPAIILAPQQDLARVVDVAKAVPGIAQVTVLRAAAGCCGRRERHRCTCRRRRRPRAGPRGASAGGGHPAGAGRREAAAHGPRPGRHRRPRRRAVGHQPGRADGHRPRPWGHRAGRAHRDPARPGAAAALAGRAAAAGRGQRAVVRRDHRRQRTGVQPPARPAGRRPRDPAVRVRVPGGARHRLLDLPDDHGCTRSRVVEGPGRACSPAWRSPAASSPAPAWCWRRPSERWRPCRCCSCCRSRSSSRSACCSTRSSSARCSCPRWPTPGSSGLVAEPAARTTSRGRDRAELVHAADDGR